MKRIGLGIGALIIAGTIYYFTIGSTQIVKEIKRQINAELTTLPSKGFLVDNRKSKEESEHFVITFNDPKKISNFLMHKGVQISHSDAKILKGLKLGVDISYLKDTYSSISFDVYPLALPTSVNTSATDEDDKKALAHIDNILKKKTFLMHVDVNKIGTAFKGNIKDINETILPNSGRIKGLNLNMTGLTFSGDLKDNALHNIQQNLKNVAIHIPDEMKMRFSGLDADYTFTGKTSFDYAALYTVDAIQSEIKNKLNIEAMDLTIKANSKSNDGLANADMKSAMKQINIKIDNDRYVLHKFAFDISAKNLDVASFTQLQNIDPNDEKQAKMLMQKLLSKGIIFEIPTLSVENIDTSSDKLGAFDMKGHMAVDKTIDITAIARNPMATLNAIDANLKLSLSKEIYTILSQQPQAMMLAMMFQPKDVNGSKVYDLELKDGKVLINGNPMM